MLSAMIEQLNEAGLHDNFLSVGRHLSSSKWKELCEDEEFPIHDDTTRAMTAVLLENTSRFLASLDETTRAVAIGDFQKFAFPLVRSIYPNLVSNYMVSIQPMLGPTSLVFYLDYVYGSNKGKVRRGDTAFSSVARGPRNVTYSSPSIDEEVVGTGDGSTTQYSNVTLAFGPVVPGTVIITDGISTITDNGAGAFVGDINGGGTNTINYGTGVISFRFSTAPIASAPITIQYTYDMEANTNIPQMDMVLQSASVTARPRKLRTSWSLESAFNLRALHGLEAEVELTAAVGSEIKYEVDSEVILDLQRMAGAGSAFWNRDLPSGVGYTEHKLSIVDAFTTLSNLIHKNTGRARATWLLCGENVATIVETLPGFQPDPSAANSNSKGVCRCGRLNGMWDVFKDPFYGDNNFMMGHKGDSFLSAGYVLAPYIPLYSTPTVVLDDFIARKGLAMQYGKKAINPLFYGTGQIGTGAQLESASGVAPGTISNASKQAILTHGSALDLPISSSSGRGVFGAR